MTYIAPAGTPITLRNVASSLGCVMRPGHPARELSVALSRIAGTSHCWPVSSGRAALTLILQAMHTCRSDRDEVVVPAYTCMSVPASVVRAGLRVRVCDVDPYTLGINPAALEQVDFRRVLAVVSANLYGLPNSLPKIEAIAHREGVFMIDDAAQALGATVGGRAVGSFGDAGLYSFDKGKIICTIQGGAIVSRNDVLAEELDKLTQSLPAPGFFEAGLLLAKLVFYSAFLRPRFYGLVCSMPFLGLGRNDYDTRYPISRLGRFQVAMALTLLGRLQELNERRCANAARLARTLEHERGIELPTIPDGAEPVYARFPIRTGDRLRRDMMVRRLNEAGIGATRSYELALVDHPTVMACALGDSGSCRGAREVAATLLTLPTHAYCPQDIDHRISEIIRGLDA